MPDFDDRANVRPQLHCRVWVASSRQDMLSFGVLKRERGNFKNSSS